MHSMLPILNSTFSRVLYSLRLSTIRRHNSTMNLDHVTFPASSFPSKKIVNMVASDPDYHTIA